VLTTGLLTGWVTRLMRQPKARAVIGVSLIAFGVESVWFVPQHDHAQMDHASHANSTVTDKLSDGALRVDARGHHCYCVVTLSPIFQALGTRHE
jgi:hypothetical protein